MDNKLFRKEAIDRIESPERLNDLIKITSSRDWLISITLIGIVVAIVLWGFFGQLPTYVKGQGILLKTDGITEVSSISPGKVIETVVVEGSFVNENDIIAYIEQPELKLKIENEQSKLIDFQKNYNRIQQFGAENIEKKEALLLKEKTNKLKSIESNLQRIAFLKDRVEAQHELVDKGLLTKDVLNETKNKYFDVQQNNDFLNNELKRINLEIFQITEQYQIELNELKIEILLIKNRIRELNALYQLNSVIRTPTPGKVLELFVRNGSVVYKGSKVARVEPFVADSEVSAIIYVNPHDGKKIEQGMKVKVSPSTIQEEEFGYMLGTVKNVAEYPATRNGMLRVLGNEDLVNSFSLSQPPIAVTVELISDSSTFSGFKWTSLVGPQQEINTGTLCSSKIVVETKKPIQLLIPPKITGPVAGAGNRLKNFSLEFFEKKKIAVKDSVVKDTIETTKVNNIAKTNVKVEIDPLSVANKHEGSFAIQILATKYKTSKPTLKKIYKGSLEISEHYKQNLYKYSIGRFNSREEARAYKKNNELPTDFFVVEIIK